MRRQHTNWVLNEYSNIVEIFCSLKTIKYFVWTFYCFLISLPSKGRSAILEYNLTAQKPIYTSKYNLQNPSSYSSGYCSQHHSLSLPSQNPEFSNCRNCGFDYWMESYMGHKGTKELAWDITAWNGGKYSNQYPF